MTANRAELTAVSGKREFLESQLDNGSAGSGKAIESELAKARAREMELKEIIAKRQAAYNVTPRGLSELEDRANDASLSDAERQAAKDDLEVAQKAVAIRAEDRAKSYERQENFRAYMAAHGVSKEKIDEVIKLASTDTGSPWPRTPKRYKAALESARANVKNELARYKAKVMEIQGRDRRHDSKQEELAQVEAEHKKKMTELKKRNAEAKLVYDATDEGREAFQTASKAEVARLNKAREAALREGNVKLAAGETMNIARVLSSIEVRQKRIEGIHAARRSDRNTRDLIKRRIRDMADEAGIDKKAAQAAWVTPPIRHTDPESRVRAVDVHVTEEDHSELVKAYSKTKAFEQHGEDGFNPWVAQRFMASPSTKLDGKSVEDMQVSAELFNMAKVGRRWTSKAGKRDVRVRPTLSAADRRTIAMRAEACHMDKSSYMRAMALEGGNPWLVQNDRSALHHEKKIAKIREVINEPKESKAV